MSSFFLPVLGFWSVRNATEDKYSKTTMNLCDLNQTEEAGKAHAVLVRLFLQKFGSVQMGSICAHSLPPGPSGKAHGISTRIPHRCYSSPLLMRFALSSTEVVYLDMVPATRQPETQGWRERAPARRESSNPIPISHVWFWKTLFKSRQQSWGERTQNHHSEHSWGKNPG